MIPRKANLHASLGTSPETQGNEPSKREETKRLIEYIVATPATDLSEVKAFLQANGFVNNRNHDYFHPELGIILEDLHDENVLTAHGILYFIDTVFYLKPKIFWS